MSWPLHINTQGATPVCSVHNALGVNPGVIAGASGRGDMTIRQLTRCPRLSWATRTPKMFYVPRATHTLSLSLSIIIISCNLPAPRSRHARTRSPLISTIRRQRSRRACVRDGTPPAIPRGELARVHVFRRPTPSELRGGRASRQASIGGTCSVVDLNALVNRRLSVSGACK